MASNLKTLSTIATSVIPLITFTLVALILNQLYFLLHLLPPRFPPDVFLDFDGGDSVALQLELLSYDFIISSKRKHDKF